MMLSEELNPGEYNFRHLRPPGQHEAKLEAEIKRLRVLLARCEPWMMILEDAGEAAEAEFWRLIDEVKKEMNEINNEAKDEIMDLFEPPLKASEPPQAEIEKLRNLVQSDVSRLAAFRLLLQQDDALLKQDDEIERLRDELANRGTEINRLHMELKKRDRRISNLIKVPLEGESDNENRGAKVNEYGKRAAKIYEDEKP